MGTDAPLSATSPSPGSPPAAIPASGPTPRTPSRVQPPPQLSPPHHDSLGLTYLTSICCWGRGGRRHQKYPRVSPPGLCTSLMFWVSCPAWKGCVSLSLQECGRAASTSLFSHSSGEPTALNGCVFGRGHTAKRFLGEKKIVSTT